MKDKDTTDKRRRRIEDVDEFEVEVPDHRPRVDRDEQAEYEEWRRERGGRGRKRRGHREHHRKDEDES